MHYTIYKTINQINQKFYIGKHQTLDINDEYLGSGKLINRAIEKYGVENFKKEILFVFETEQEMNDKEKEIVTPEFVKRKDVYNICEGGKGGWGYINSVATIEMKSLAGKKGIKALWEITYSDPIKLARHKTSSAIRLNQLRAEGKLPRGKNTSASGTIWINNGENNKRISKENLDKYLKMNYTVGRKKNIT